MRVVVMMYGQVVAEIMALVGRAYEVSCCCCTRA